MGCPSSRQHPRELPPVLRNISGSTIEEVATAITNRRAAVNICTYDYDAHLRAMIGGPPAELQAPSFPTHAHHILFKIGNGPGQQALVEEGQAILRRAGIDPIMGVENLEWAPNISGQHTIEALQPVVEALRAAEEAGGGYDRITQVLQQMGRVAARRR